MSIYVHHNGQQLGPFTEEQLKAQLASGAISIQDHVWWDGQKDWAPLSQTPFGGLHPGAPVIPGTAATAAYPVGVQAPTSKLAIWALVCGCASIVCAIFSSIPAIILGHMGLRQIKRNPGMQGEGTALAGMILGYVFTGTWVLMLPFISVVAISVLIALGNQVKGVYTTINSEQAITAPDSTTNSAPGK